MFTVRLIPKAEYSAKEIAQNTQAWLNGCVGIAEKTPELALIRAREALNCTEHGDELGKYYTFEVVQICEVCGGEHISFDDLKTSVHNVGVSVPCTCEGCGVTWQNEYSFTQTFNLEK
jgi:predicted methyltransferase